MGTGGSHVEQTCNVAMGRECQRKHDLACLTLQLAADKEIALIRETSQTSRSIARYLAIACGSLGCACVAWYVYNQMRQMIEREEADRMRRIRLMETARSGDLEIFMELAEGPHPFPTDCMDDRGKTPLIYAAAFGRKDIVDYLLASGHPKPFSADIVLQADGVRVCLSNLAGDVVTDNTFAKQATLKDFCNAIQHDVATFEGARLVFLSSDCIQLPEGSCLKGFQNFIVKQCRAEIDVNAMDDTQKTALHHACKAPRAKDTPEDHELGTIYAGVVKTLIERMADIEARDKNGCTALMFAVANGFSPAHVGPLLLEAGADVNAKDFEGHSAMDYAKHFGHFNYVPLLRSYGATESDEEEPDVATTHDEEPMVLPLTDDAILVEESCGATFEEEPDEEAPTRKRRRRTSRYLT